MVAKKIKDKAKAGKLKTNPTAPPTSVPSKKYKRIYDLGDERRAYIDSMFLDGKPVPEIMLVLRDGWGLFTDIAEGTLSKFLYRYKWDVIDKGLAVKQEMMMGKKAVALVEVVEQFNLLEELGELITVQKTRVGKLLMREKDMPMLFNSLGGEMKTLASFLQQYTDLSFDLGVLKRAPQLTKITKDGETTFVESEGFANLQFSMENATKIEDAARAFFRVLEHGEHEVGANDTKLLKDIGLDEPSSVG